jgi:NTE family protein
MHVSSPYQPFIMRYPIVFLILVFSVLNSSVHAQENRPKVGLVLSGGGALGLAHVGVIKVLEERGIVPDYIVGTSMGSIVGGLYALGYSSDEMLKMIQEIDWDQVLSNKIPLPFIAFQEKEFYNRFMMELKWENKELKFPSGLIHSQALTETLIKLTWPAVQYKNFDEFPIPFRCIGTDVSTGKEIIYKEGSLATALRASMAIPSAFTPVENDSTMVVDGGVLNNFPVDVVIKMGADIVIGSDVTTGYKNAYDLESMTKILYQIAMFPSLSKLQKNRDDCDLYFHHNLEGYAMTDFAKYDSIIGIGEKDALMQLDRIDSLVKVIQPRPHFKMGDKYPDSVFVEHIDVKFDKSVSNSSIEKRLGLKENSYFSNKALIENSRKLIGSRYINSIEWWANKKDGGKNKYDLDLKIREYPRTMFKTAIHYDNTFSIGVLLNITTRNWIMPGTRWVVEGDISESPKLRANFIKYFGRSQQSGIVAEYFLTSLNMPVYDKGDISSYELFTRHFASLGYFVGRKLSNQFDIGYTYHFAKRKIKLNEQGLKNTRVLSNEHMAYIRIRSNTTDKQYYPDKGKLFNFWGSLNYFSSLNARLSSDTLDYVLENGDTIHFAENELNQYIEQKLLPQYPFVKASVQYYRFIPLSGKFYLNLGFAGSFSFTTENNSNERIYSTYMVGGFSKLFYFDQRMYGFRYAELSVMNLALAGFELKFMPAKNLFVMGGVQGLVYNENIIAIQQNLGDQFNDIIKNGLLGYGLRLAYRSPIGPIEINFSWNTNDPYGRTGIFFGYVFK